MCASLAGHDDAGRRMTFRHSLRSSIRWMLEHAGRKCSPKTFERYGELGAYAIRQNVEIAGRPHRFGEVTLEKFGPMQMELLINGLLDHGGQKTKEIPEGKPPSAKSVRHIACVVHGCFEKAVKW